MGEMALVVLDSCRVCFDEGWYGFAGGGALDECEARFCVQECHELCVAGLGSDR